MTAKSWIVHGPKGCGKTTNARRIADALGLERVFDDWDGQSEPPMRDTLVLTTCAPPFYIEPHNYQGRRVLTYAEAMQRVRAGGW